ncbi:MAG: hypothetical protein GF418_06880 [Chitinivibrionales bacterium]|nr:hypothetical protein [Chitinivibrionales bacterium]MBD3395334.1 hypothetical protein [Chitinivibrionales bacterium]
MTKRKCNELKQQFKKVEREEDYFAEARGHMEEALEQLGSAATYYTLYFRSEDAAQEEMRERMMRQRARGAYELFKKAASELASQG